MTVVESIHELASARGLNGTDLLDVRPSEGRRLFTEDMLSRAERRNRQRLVLVIRGRNKNRVESWVGDDLLGSPHGGNAAEVRRTRIVGDHNGTLPTIRDRVSPDSSHFSKTNQSNLGIEIKCS